MWMVLLYLPDKRDALANLARAVAPGGVVLLCNQPDHGIRFNHPVMTEVVEATFEMARRFDLLLSVASLVPALDDAGFEHVTSVTLEYPLGGATSAGQRWWAHLLATVAGTRRAVVEVGHVMDGSDFDRKIDLLAAEPMLRHSGSWDFLLTLARRRDGEDQ
jgi:hypothetical protein